MSTQPKSETRARINLERQGWPSFYPVLSTTIRSGRRMSTQLRPLFSGYVFVQLDPLRSRWRSVDGTFGVRSIIKRGEQPAPLPPGYIETMMAMADVDGRVTFASALNPGENVKFLSGPFAGLIGKLEHLNAQGRITVMLDLLGRATPIRALASEVLPAAS